MKSKCGPVYCFGHVSTGVILQLKMPYPSADGYAEVARTLENHAGEATGTALVLNRLGVPVSLEGNWIGDVPACRNTLEFLRGRGIDVSGLRVKPDYAGVTEVVISDGASRTVFGRYCDLLFTTRQWEMPDPDKIAGSRFVCVDPSFGEATLRAARTARGLGIPVAACDARADSDLAAFADVLIVSGELMRREYPDACDNAGVRASLFDEYLSRCPGLVVFTSGSEEVWHGRRGAGERRGMPPFSVDVVDSAGAGDSFRGGLVYGLLRGWNDQEALRFACAVAALICTTAPGCVNAPTLAQVTAFLSERGVCLPD